MSDTMNTDATLTNNIICFKTQYVIYRYIYTHTLPLPPFNKAGPDRPVEEHLTLCYAYIQMWVY